jgi:hypothetical protein
MILVPTSTLASHHEISAHTIPPNPNSSNHVSSSLWAAALTWWYHHYTKLSLSLHQYWHHCNCRIIMSTLTLWHIHYPTIMIQLSYPRLRRTQEQGRSIYPHNHRHMDHPHLLRQQPEAWDPRLSSSQRYSWLLWVSCGCVVAWGVGGVGW